MTSKEALNQLYIMADTPELAIGIQSCYDIVEKNLEVLEIIRKCFAIIPKEEIRGQYYITEIVAHEDNKESWSKIDRMAVGEITKEEYEILKEWLENE